MLQQITQIQFVFYLSRIDATSRLRIANRVGETLVELAVDPVLLPVLEGAPSDMPQILIENEKSGWAFHFAPSRCDLFYSVPNTENTDNVLEHFRNELEALWSMLQTEFLAKNSRLGIVVNFDIPISDARYLFKARCNDLFLPADTEEIQLHFLRKTSLNDFDLNCWTRLRTQRGDNQQPDTLAVLVDVNTVSDKDLAGDDSEILSSFFGTSTHLINQSMESVRNWSEQNGQHLRT